jgi:small-conductance mechanosensitive channel
LEYWNIGMMVKGTVGMVEYESKNMEGRIQYIFFFEVFPIFQHSSIPVFFSGLRVDK